MPLGKPQFSGGMAAIPANQEAGISRERLTEVGVAEAGRCGPTGSAALGDFGALSGNAAIATAGGDRR